MKNRFEIISGSVSKGEGFGTQGENREHGATFPLFSQNFACFCDAYATDFPSFVKMMSKWKDVVPSVAFPIVSF